MNTIHTSKRSPMDVKHAYSLRVVVLGGEKKPANPDGIVAIFDRDYSKEWPVHEAIQDLVWVSDRCDGM